MRPPLLRFEKLLTVLHCLRSDEFIRWRCNQRTNKIRHYKISSMRASRFSPKTNTASRAALYAATLFLVLTINFFLPRVMPGDPLLALQDPSNPVFIYYEQIRAQALAYYGLDKPLLAEYFIYLQNDIETLFAYPGIGRLLFFAVTVRDYPVMVGAFLVLTLAMLLAKFLADVFYAWLDPRVAG